MKVERPDIPVNEPAPADGLIVPRGTDDETSLALVPLAPERQDRQLLPKPDEFSMIVEFASRAPLFAGKAVPAAYADPGIAFAAIMGGFELGFSPMTALRHMVVINGRTEPDSQAMMGLCTANEPGLWFRWIKVARDGAIVELIRKGRVRVRAEYTDDDAFFAHQGVRPKVARWEAPAAGSKSGKKRPVFAKDPEGNLIYEPVEGPWQTHRQLMMAYNAAKIAMKLGAPDLINLVMAKGSAAHDVNAALAEALDESLPPLVEHTSIRGTGETFNAPSWETAGDPETKARLLVEAVRAECLKQGATLQEIAALVGGGTANQIDRYLREYELSLPQLVAKARGVELPAEVMDASADVGEASLWDDPVSDDLPEETEEATDGEA